MLEDNIFEDEIFDDELGQVWLVAEAPSRDIAEQLADLHSLKGAGFISMLKEITQQRAFTPLEGEAFEVLVFKGSKSILIKRKAALDKSFVKKFMFAYNK